MVPIGPANKNELKIEASHCYNCGKPFTSEDPKTKHHSIPKSMKPDRNVLLPVHKSCHQKIHEAITLTKPDFEAYENMVRGLGSFYIRQKKQLEKVRVDG